MRRGDGRMDKILLYRGSNTWLKQSLTGTWKARIRLVKGGSVYDIQAERKNRRDLYNVLTKD